jgi:lipoyl(octanoyl) transferase
VIISVVQLGRIDYATGLRLQQTLVDLRKEDKIGNVLLLLEHTPVITLGRNARRENVLASDAFLKQRGVELFECDRGGDVTFHGPGQLVGYPIFDLRSFSGPDGQRKTLGAVDYVRRLEETLIRTCADFGIATERVKGMTGVWTQIQTSVIPSEDAPRSERPGFGREQDASESRDPYTSRNAQGKIAAIGVHISRGVTSHGFALNVSDEPLQYFQLIVPCGIASKPVTSIQRELCGPGLRPGVRASETPATQPGAKASLDDAAQSVARNFGRVFNAQVLWVETLDALLGRKVGVPARPPEELRKITGQEDKFWA